MFMMSLETVNINIPAECHSFTLLGKLSGDPKIHQFVKVLSLNEELIQQPELFLERLQEFHENSKIQSSNHTSTPLALVSESAHPYKIIPTHHVNKRKTRSYQNPSAHLSTAQALVTGEIFDERPEELIIDCGATHHMFNSRGLFSSFVKTPPTAVSTGNSTSSLLSKGSGTLVKLLKHKSEALKQFIIAKTYMEKIQDQTLKKLVSDQGGQFLNRDFKALAELECHQDWKLGPVGETGVLLSYENGNSSYRVLQLSNRKILISKHVQFEESNHPFVQPSLPADKSKATGNNDNLVVGEMDGTRHPYSVEVVDEPHLTEVVEAEEVDEVCSAAPDCNSRGVDESLFPSGDLNTAS
ncbi:hypothetical protein O181_021327 [Austropuccinia psidii MF-1]|uniref:Retroviral polymerase SH3-like domain-containing protein n=1 Tax=Austropuccinia psidii MF-1 TaxID=1389203 RepID=A0A9Q3CDF9_9BASI|nr:hypothetical protein [Austropuccinia psidii MF-1]